MRMETARLILRPWEEADAQALYRYAKDESVGPAAGWTPHTSVEYSREIIRTVLSRPETYAVVLKSAGEPVGSVGIMFPPGGSAPMEEGEAEIGYWLGEEYQGRGIMTRCVEALCGLAFSELNINRIQIQCAVGNTKSSNIPRRLGFTLEGIARAGELQADGRFSDIEVYSLLREEYIPRGKRTQYDERRNE